MDWPSWPRLRSGGEGRKWGRSIGQPRADGGSGTSAQDDGLDVGVGACYFRRSRLFPRVGEGGCHSWGGGRPKMAEEARHSSHAVVADAATRRRLDNSMVALPCIQVRRDQRVPYRRGQPVAAQRGLVQAVSTGHASPGSAGVGGIAAWRGILPELAVIAILPSETAGPTRSASPRAPPRALPQARGRGVRGRP